MTLKVVASHDVLLGCTQSTSAGAASASPSVVAALRDVGSNRWAEIAKLTRRMDTNETGKPHVSRKCDREKH